MKVGRVISLYSSINKATGLGLTYDSSLIAARDLDELYILHSAILEVKAARSKKRKA